MSYCRECGEELDSGHRHCPNCGEENPDFRGGCFIATTTYRSPFAEEVETLRNWRDSSLQNSFLGNKFIGLYYKFAPSIAKIIKNKKVLRKISKFFLNPLTKFLKKKGY